MPRRILAHTEAGARDLFQEWVPKIEKPCVALNPRAGSMATTLNGKPVWRRFDLHRPSPAGTTFR